MTDYTKLVEALRYCVSGVCKNCSYFEKCKKNGTAMAKLHNDAAAAIEELQAEVKELKRLNMELFDDLPKLGEWVGVSPMVDTVQCSVCGGQLFSAELETPYCPYCGAKMEVQE